MHYQTHSFLTENPSEDVAGVILSRAASCRAGQEPPSCLLVSCTLPRLQRCCIAPWLITGKFPLQQAFCTWMLPSFWSSASLLLLPAKSPQITGSLIVKTHLPGKQQFLRHITTGLSHSNIQKCCRSPESLGAPFPLCEAADSTTQKGALQAGQNFCCRAQDEVSALRKKSRSRGGGQVGQEALSPPWGSSAQQGCAPLVETAIGVRAHPASERSKEKCLSKVNNL